MSTTRWSCPICTFINPIQSTKCDICETAKPSTNPVLNYNNNNSSENHNISNRLKQTPVEQPQQNILHPTDFSRPTYPYFASNNSANRNVLHESSNNSNHTTLRQKRSSFLRMVGNTANPAQTSSNTKTNVSNVNSTPSNSSSSQAIQNRRVVSKRSAKRTRQQMKEEAKHYDDDDCDDDNEIPPQHNTFRIKEEEVKDHWQHDIISQIGRKWAPFRSNKEYIDPLKDDKIRITCSNFMATKSEGFDMEFFINRGLSYVNQYAYKGSYFAAKAPEQYPWIVIDLMDIKVHLSRYDLLHNTFGDYDNFNDLATEWIVRGSNDLQTWTQIHYGRRSQPHSSEFLAGSFNAYYSKFKFALAAPNHSGRNVFKIAYLKLYGTVRRKAYKVKRENEIKEHIVFPSISSKRFIGDPNKIVDILNDWDGLQHNECKEYKENIPDLNVELFPYQKKGLQWMLNRENNEDEEEINGGLLCDEMGLGKTVQTIALMLVQKQHKQQLDEHAKDRTIIVTPLSLIDQWISELNNIAKEGTFKIINYYGAHRKKIKRTDFETCDVVLSTLDTFSTIIGKITKEWDDFADEFWKKGRKQQLLYKLESGFFDRIVIDEAHEIKNTTSKRSSVLSAFAAKCKHKWCLTATPINNDLPVDLAGLCRFLGISHTKYCNKLKLSETEIASEAIGDKFKNKRLWMDLDNNVCMNKIKTFLQPIMIRRIKQKVLTSSDLVDKQEIIIKIHLKNEERVIYSKIANEAKVQYQEFKRNKSIGLHYTHLIRMLSKLRKICDHPSMVFNALSPNLAMENNIMDFAANVDVLEKLHAAIVKRLNGMESILEYECPICFECTDLNGALLSGCGHLFCVDCLLESMQGGTAGKCGICRHRFTKRDIIKINYVLKSKKLEQRHKDEYEEYKVSDRKKKGNEVEDEDDEMSYDKYEKYIEKYKEVSCITSKLEALVERLKDIKINHTDDKAIVFSNFTKYLSIASKTLDEKKIKHFTFHSGLNRRKRAQVLEQFEKANDVDVLLISAKCASVGLNLTCANHVIFLDPRINAGLDEQAIGRCLRIGQTKTVYVTRLITERTVEEKILSLQQTQHQQDGNEDNTTNVNLKRKAKLTEKDYDFIFG